MLENIKPERAAEPDRIAKYTTLDTLVNVLESRKIRMNSIVSMNDKTETGFLEEYIRNYEEDFDEERNKYLFADKEFITSFTTRIGWFINRDNGILTPFIERKIKREGEGDRMYPFRLSGIILGPASQEQTANMMQVLNMAAQYHYSLFVQLSKITSYR